MLKLYKILFSSSRQSFVFISFIIFLSLFSFIFTGSLIHSIEKYINSSAKDFLGADLIIESQDNSLADTSKYIGDNYEAETSKKISFETSIFQKNTPGLYSINFIEENYPFYGDFEKNMVNQNGTLIVSKKVYDDFGNEPIEILGKNYFIGSYLSENSLSNFNPFGNNEIYIPYDEYDTKQLNELSRIEYSLLLKTKQTQQIQNDDTLKNFQINSQQSSNNNFNALIERFRVFIQIFYQIIILFAFFIISVSLNSYFKKVTKDLKVMNILGLSHRIIISNIFAIFFFIAVFSSLISYGFVSSIFYFFGNTVSILDMNINLLYQSIFISFLIILSGSFLNLIDLKARSINNFIQKNALSRFKTSILIYIVLLSFLLIIISLFSGVSFLFSVIIGVGFILIIGVLIFLFRFILGILFGIYSKLQNKDFYLFDAIRSTIKPGSLSVIIILSSCISLSGFLVFATFSNAFIKFLDNNTQGRIDTFVINLGEQDIPTIKKYFDESQYYEIIKSRILEINGVPLKNHLNTDRVSGRYSREFNTTTKNLDDLIIEGNPLKSGEVGVDAEFANSLGIFLGDSITFSILGIEKELRVIQIREAVRDGFSPFFYFNFYPQDFNGFSKNYFLNYSSKEKQNDFSAKLSQELGAQATFIDVRGIIEKIKNISQYILYFVYIILGYIALFSIITFVVSINFLKSFKQNKLNIYNKFGGIKQKLEAAILYEYAYLIIIGAVFSLIISFLISYLLFTNNDFLNFKGEYFWQSILYIALFFILYIAIYFVIYMKKKK